MIPDDDVTTIDGDTFFDEQFGTDEPSEQPTQTVDEPEDATPDDPSDEADIELDASGTDEDEDEDTDEDPGGVDDTDPEDVWLDGFENRFRKGEEHKVLTAYQELEAFHSKRTNELQQEIEQARNAAFQQAKELLIAEAPQASPLELATQRSQLVGLAYSDPQVAYEAALEMGDPKAINAVIQAISYGEPSLDITGNPALAAQLQMQTAEQRQAQRYQEQEAVFAKREADLNLKSGFSEFEDANDELLDNPAFKEVFGSVVHERINRLDASSPQAVKAFFDECGDLAYGRAARNGALAQQPAETAAPVDTTVSRNAKRTAAVDTTKNRRVNRDADQPTPAEAYADDLLAMAQAESPRW